MEMHKQTAMERAHFLIDSEREEAVEFCASGFIGLRRLFWTWPTVKDFAKALPGVSDDTLCRMIDLPARTIVDGKHMVAILALDPLWGWNIAAWCINAPEDFYVWRFDCGGFMLGREQMEEHLLQGTMPLLIQTPLEWLQGGMRGIVVL